MMMTLTSAVTKAIKEKARDPLHIRYSIRTTLIFFKGKGKGPLHLRIHLPDSDDDLDLRHNKGYKGKGKGPSSHGKGYKGKLMQWSADCM